MRSIFYVEYITSKIEIEYKLSKTTEIDPRQCARLGELNNTRQ